MTRRASAFASAREAADRLAELRVALHTARPMAATTKKDEDQQDAVHATSVPTGNAAFGPLNQSRIAPRAEYTALVSTPLRGSALHFVASKLFIT